MANKEDPLFVTWADDKGRETALAIASKAMSFSQPLHRTRASDIYRDVDGTRTGVRDGFNRQDYNVFRPDEAVPTDPKQVIKSCRSAYRKIGLINNIVNLMADFTIQGISLTHPNRRIAKFMNEWWDKVNGREVSGKFAKNIYRDGIAVSQRTTAKLKAKDIENLQKGFATGADMEPERPIKIEKNEIPWEYTFLNPLVLTPLGDDLAVFTGGKVRYAIEVRRDLNARIKNPQTAEDKAIVSSIPKNILDAIKRGDKTIPLDPSKISVSHYKKDDWELWSDPMLFSVMDDLVLLNKMKLADLAALDGAISHIRVWKLGDIENKIMPTPAAYEKLASILLNNTGGGTIDLIWTPDIQLEETSTEVHRFLGDTKYAAVLNAIYAGLGIPPTLTGGSNAAGFTNNYISIQTLLERLNYVRMALTEFWNRELKMVQRAMGFRFPAEIKFDMMTLTDKTAEKNILIQLYDRGVIQLETLQELIDLSPEVEMVRDRRERRLRENGRLSRKGGPWNNPEQKEALSKIALQTGVATPSQVGLELGEKKAGEKSALDLKATSSPANKGQPQQGRPGGSTDKKKRKTKTVKPRASAMLASDLAWALRVQKKISSVIDPIWLEITQKTDARKLSDDEVKSLENLKLAVLCSLDLYSDYSEETILNVFKGEASLCIPTSIENLINFTSSKFVEQFGKEPSLDELRNIKANVYALYKGDY